MRSRKINGVDQSTNGQGHNIGFFKSTTMSACLTTLLNPVIFFQRILMVSLLEYK
jgi:hypothetical protein